jgi:hypothetical protein
VLLVALLCDRSVLCSQKVEAAVPFLRQLFQFLDFRMNGQFCAIIVTRERYRCEVKSSDCLISRGSSWRRTMVAFASRSSFALENLGVIRAKSTYLRSSRALISGISLWTCFSVVSRRPRLNICLMSSKKLEEKGLQKL